MIDKNEINVFIRELEFSMRGIMYFREIEYSIVRLLFLKYCVDNYIGAKTLEDMQDCARAQKTLSMRNVESGLGTIIPVLQYIDKAYGLNSILSSSEVIEEYGSILFGYESKNQRRNVTHANYQDVMHLLTSIDLEEEKNSHAIGDMIVDALVRLINERSYRNGRYADNSTKPQLSKLASRLLDVSDADVFCDFMSGTGISTLSIVKNKSTVILNADIDEAVISISSMLYILAGFENFKVICSDTLKYGVPNFKGNKLFVDAPFGWRIEKTPENDYTDSSLAAINRAVFSYMDETNDSEAVIVVPSSVLFKSNKQYIDFRAKFIDSGLLKAVIALPALKNATLVNVNLLYLSNKKSDSVIMYDASNSANNVNKRFNIDGSLVLPDEEIEKIVSAIRDNKIEEGRSNIVSITKIKKEKNNYNILPSMYIVQKSIDDEETLEDINSKLAELYKQLTNN